jgi:hypothetical protein
MPRHGDTSSSSAIPIPRARKELEYSFGPRFRKDRTTSEMIGELQTLVSYLEDVKRLSDGGLQRQASELRNLAKRLSDLAGNEDAAGDARSQT